MGNIRKWWCKKFGHSIHVMDAAILRVEIGAIFFPGKITVKCSTCKENVFPEIMKDFEKKYGHPFKLPEGATY